MKYRRQEPPNAVQIELVEGCQLRCSFCGLNGIRGKDNNFKFMEKDTLQTLCLQMREQKWNPRIELAVHGEPTWHPKLIEMVGLIRTIGPDWYIMMTSNGGGLLGKPGPLTNIRNLFETAGLNTLALDDYDGAKIVPKIRKALEDEASLADVIVLEYPEEPHGNPHVRSSDKRLVFVEDIGKASTGTHSVLNNHAGAGAPPNDSGMGKRCAKPFRELTVRWDGSVAICCNDWRGIFKCGSVVTDGLDKVWNGDAMGAARIKLYRGERDFGPCLGCDATSYRVGLLPDKLGKVTLPKPNKQVEQDLKTACAGESFTKLVPREWERDTDNKKANRA